MHHYKDTACVIDATEIWFITEEMYVGIYILKHTRICLRSYCYTKQLQCRCVLLQSIYNTPISNIENVPHIGDIN